MKNDSPFHLWNIMFSMILLFLGMSSGKPLDYEDVANLLPTEPETTNDTLVAIVQDPVVQDAVQNTVGNGSLEGLVVKKKVLIMPATEPTKVVSQREQVLVVPMTHLENVRKNITETVNAETDADGLALTDVQSFTEDDENGYTSPENEVDPSYALQHDDFYETLAEISKTTLEPMSSIDNTRQEIPYLVQDPTQEIPGHHMPTISVPIIAFLDPVQITDDKIIPITTILPKEDGTFKSRQLNQLKEGRDEIQRNVQNYVDQNSLSVNSDNWRLTSSPSEIQVSPTLYESTTIENQYENSLPIVVPRINIVTPLFWTSDADTNYPKDPHDMDVAAHIIFRPLFRFRQEEQQRSWRRGADNDYRRSPYERYNSYPRRNYRYRPRYNDDYY